MPSKNHIREIGYHIVYYYDFKCNCDLPKKLTLLFYLPIITVSKSIWQKGGFHFTFDVYKYTPIFFLPKIPILRNKTFGNLQTWYYFRIIRALPNSKKNWRRRKRLKIDLFDMNIALIFHEISKTLISISRLMVLLVLYVNIVFDCK